MANLAVIYLRTQPYLKREAATWFLLIVVTLEFMPDVGRSFDFSRAVRNRNFLKSGISCFLKLDHLKHRVEPGGLHLGQWLVNVFSTLPSSSCYVESRFHANEYYNTYQICSRNHCYSVWKWEEREEIFNHQFY